LKEFGQRLSIIDVQCTALDATPVRTELSGGKTGSDDLACNVFRVATQQFLECI
jgi:hypothetical protein